MHMKNDDLIRQRLRQWEPVLEEDPGLAAHVLNRIGAGGPRDALARSLLRWRWLAAGLGAAAALLLVWLAGSYQANRELRQDRAYLSLIDPVFRSQSEALPAGAEAGNLSLIDQLAWLQDRLDLSRDQFLELVNMHQRYAGQMDTLYRQLIELDGMYAAFEASRLRDEPIDFISLYDVLVERREVVSDSRAIREELVSMVESILNPAQRVAYMALLDQRIRTGDA